MVKMKIFIVPWIWLIVIHLTQCQYCPIQKHIQFDSLITWYTSEPKYVVSDPPCINDRYEITKRKCTEIGRWVPPKPPSCKLIQQRFMPSCPFDFIMKNNLCVFVSKLGPWKTKCPFPNDLVITEPENIEVIFTLNVSEFWLPVKRNQPFGKFVWIHPHKLNIKYKHTALKKAVKEEDNIHDCIIITKINNLSKKANKSDITYDIKIVNCNANYKQVCLYDIRSNFSPTSKNVTCFTSKKNTCYSLTASTRHQGRDAFCENYAKPSTQLENFMIKNLVKDNVCWIGLKRNQLQRFQWENSRNYPQFTDWKITANFNKHLVGISKYGWELYNDYTLNCGICEVNIEKMEINLSLRANLKSGLLILTVYSPSYFLNEDQITCSIVGTNDVNLEFKILFSSKIIPKNKQYSNNLLNELSEKDDRIIYFLRPNTKYFNYYSCEGIILPNSSIISTEKVLFGTKQYDNEYALHMIIEDFCEYPYKCDPVFNDRYKEIFDKIDSDIFEHIRPMKILSIANKSLELIVHIHVKRNHLSSAEEYLKTYNYLLYIFKKIFNMKFISLKSCLGCLPQTTLNGGEVLHWEFTNTGSTTMPNELCLDAFGLPVTRTCIGDFVTGAEWAAETGTCSPNVEFSTLTRNLHDVYLDLLQFTTDEIFTNLTTLTKVHKDLIPSDIYYISQILKYSNYRNYSNSNLIIDNIISIINNLIATDVSTLKLSNKLLNATNILLDVFEKLIEEFEDIELDDDGILQVVTPYLFYQVSDLSLNNITGVMMSGPSDKYSFTDFIFEPLHSDTNMNKLLKTENLEIATFIPDSIIEEIRNQTNTTRVYISIFYNNSLFIEDKEQDKVVESKIVSVSINGYDNYLSSPIPVIFGNKRKNKTKDFLCSYWNFGKNTYEEKYPTRWANDGGFHWNISNQDKEVCAFTHLTHFALLLGEPNTNNSIENMEYHDNILSLITAIGCCLSVLGITAISITTILFKSWRQKTGTKVLLNLSATVVLQMVVIFFADTKHFPANNTTCIILGVILHYSTISSFCWMLVIAYLQYLRFVKVIGGVPPHLLLKSGIIGWILPFIPVIGLLIWDSKSYNPMSNNESTGLCYPHGITNYVTVLLPISIVLIINLSIFCLVLYNVTQKTIPNKSNNKNLKLNQLKLAILLFFLLGITWIFGYLTVFNNCLICLYLFCSTATMQGFVLFIFYVLLDSTTRKLWIALLKPHLKITRKKSSTAFSSSTTTPDAQPNTTLSGINGKSE